MFIAKLYILDLEIRAKDAGHVAIGTFAETSGNLLDAFNIIYKTGDAYYQSRNNDDTKLETFYKTTIAFADNALYFECGVFGAIAGSGGGKVGSFALSEAAAYDCEYIVTGWRKNVVPLVKKKVIAPVGDKIVDAIYAHNKRIDRINKGMFDIFEAHDRRIDRINKGMFDIFEAHDRRIDRINKGMFDIFQETRDVSDKAINGFDNFLDSQIGWMFQ